MVPLGLSQAATVRVGLAFGRRDRDGIARAGWTAFVLGVSFMALMALVMLSFPARSSSRSSSIRPTPPTRPVIPLAISFLFVAALFQIFDGAQAVGAGMLRGLQDTKVPMAYAAFGYWVIGLTVGGLARLRARLERRRHLDRPRHRPRHRRGADDRALAAARAARAARLVGRQRP